MARQTRLKQKPSSSFLTVSGTKPIDRIQAWPFSMTSARVRVPPMMSTMLTPCSGK